MKDLALKKLKALSAAFGAVDSEIIIGNSLYTDGVKTHLPDGNWADAHFSKLSLWYLYQQTAGVYKYRDFGLEPLSDLHKSLWFSLDTIYAEKRVIYDYPGAASVLSYGVSTWVKEGRFGEEAYFAFLPLANLVGDFCTAYGRVKVLNQTSLFALSEKLKAMLDFKMPGITEQLQQIVMSVKGFTSSQQCFDAAAQIIKMLELTLETKSVEKTDGEDGDSNSDQDDGNEGEQDTQSQEQSESDEHDTGDSETAYSVQGEELTGTNQVATIEELQEALEATTVQLPNQISDDLSEQLNEVAELTAEANPEGMANGEFSMSRIRATDTDGKTPWLAKALRLSRPIRMKLESVLIARARQPKVYDSQGTILDSSLLAGVPAGNTKVFLEENVTKGTKAAVKLLVDQSSSMRGDKMRMANLTAFAVNAALDGIKGVSSATHYYPCQRAKGSENCVYVAKDWQQKANALASRFTCTASVSNTPTGKAMKQSLLDFVTNASNLRVLIVITDGASNAKEVKEALAMAKTLGVLVIAIGIQMPVEKLKGFDPMQCISIKNPDMIADAITSNLTNTFRHAKVA